VDCAVAGVRVRSMTRLRTERKLHDIGDIRVRVYETCNQHLQVVLVHPILRAVPIRDVRVGVDHGKAAETRGSEDGWRGPSIT
jgi:hypothetical protein